MLVVLVVHVVHAVFAVPVSGCAFGGKRSETYISDHIREERGLKPHLGRKRSETHVSNHILEERDLKPTF